MTINLYFNDFDEMEHAVTQLAGMFAALRGSQGEPDKPGSNVPEQPSIPPMPKKMEEAPKKPVEEAPKKEEAPAKEEAPKVDRVDLRKILSVLNKTTGENTARKLINEMGFRVLTEVPDDRLAELKAKAEEVINAQ